MGGENNPFRQLPSVDWLIAQFEASAYQHDRLVTVARQLLDSARQQILNGQASPTPPQLVQQMQDYLTQNEQGSLRPVINATGIIIHTNLGRAPLATSAIQAMHAIAGTYSTLEYDLAQGQRGHRDTHVEDLIIEVTGAEAALVVNNNASAVYLVLSALAANREIVISRGELVEIGGGFRIPDVMRQSGVNLVEVGTTNRTRLADFENVITEQTVGFLRAHASNFKLVGFTEAVALADLAKLAHEHNLLLLDDIGSGALLDTAQFGLDHEPTVPESLAAGADLIMFSGDKLLGGPQAGIIVGRRDLVEKLRKYPLTRALRPDKLCLAGLTATLQIYRDRDPHAEIPIWRMMSLPLADIHERVQQWQAKIGGDIWESESAVGGGSLPGATLPTYVLALNVANPDEFAEQLRQENPPIIGRIHEGHYCLDPRTVWPEQDAYLFETLQKYLGN